MDTVMDPERHMVSEVTIKVCLPESFPEKYRKAIVAAVNQCSVKKHLLEPPTVNTVLEIGEREAA